MNRKRRRSPEHWPTRWHRGAAIPLHVIRQFARQVAERFHPEKIVLFGSYAYGKPHADSDVDILVVMPARNQLDQAFKIRLAVESPFPLDLIVRTPKNIQSRLEDGDLFHTHILNNGKVLYEKGNSRVGEQGRGRLPGGRNARGRQRTIS